MEILYEDNHLIVAIKPRGILSQEDESSDPDMLTLLKSYIKEKYHKPGNVYLGLVHRLDRPTEGIMVFARTSKAASRLSNQIKDGVFTKKYLALVHGILDNKEGKLENYIYKDEDKKMSFITTKEKGKYACLEYRVIKEIKGNSLVDIELKTGRFHQIRVQFNHINHSLVGDHKYGCDQKKDLMLYAYHLEFNHPITKERLIFDKYKEDLC